MCVAGGGSDLAMVKLGSDGTFKWAKQLPGTAGESGNFIRAITASTFEDIVITGSFTRTVDFDPGAGTALQTSASTIGPDIFIGKYDTNGNYLWARRIGSTAQVERGYDVTVDSDGNIYTVGLFQTTVDFDPAPGAANTFNLTSAGQTDAFIQCMYGDGTFRWAVRIGGPDADEAVTIDLDDSDHPVIAGTASGTIDFDPDPTGTFMMGGPAFILKLTDLGAFQFAKQFDGAILKVFVDDTDQITFTGVYHNSIDLDPGPDVYKLEAAVDADIFVAQLDFDGSFVWGYNTNASGLEYFTNETSGVAMDSNGDIYVAGWFNNTIDVDPTNCTSPLTASSGTRETFIQKIQLNRATLCFALQPEDVNGCDTGDIHLIAEAVGTMDITYRWFYFDQLNNSFLLIDTGDPGFEGADTNELIIHATTTFGEGKYRVQVSGDNVADETSNVATVTVGITPDAPTFTPVSFCSPGFKTLMVGGNADGGYRWYEDPSGDPIAGEVNHDFTTPFLDATTTYYATFTDGGCESDFTEVEATINITLDAPIVEGAVSCSAASLTLKASSETAGEFTWYQNYDDDAAIIADASGKFITPVLSSTTSYYVALNDGSCESLRTEVVAEIGNLAIPNINPATICSNLSTTLTATGASGEIRWYSAASGGSPIHTGVTFTTPVLTVTTTYHVSAFDGSCETVRKAVTVTVNNCSTNQPPVIASTSPSINVGGTLSVNLNPLISDPDNNIDPTSLKIVVQPKSGANASIDQNGQLVIDYTGTSFSGEDELTIEVCDNAGSCFQRAIKIQVVSDLFVYNAVSPNGDGKNDVFHLAYIDLIDDTKNNRVLIFNRWGDLVFDIENYNNSTNVFEGRSNGGKELPSGTYYYRIEFLNGRKSQSGYLSLKR
jgi:gliding motility-associated-like protein